MMLCYGIEIANDFDGHLYTTFKEEQLFCHMRWNINSCLAY